MQFCAPDEVDDLVGAHGEISWLTEAESRRPGEVGSTVRFGSDHAHSQACGGRVRGTERQRAPLPRRGGALGLPAANTRIEAFEDESAIVVERFDRATRDGALLRVHQEDLCQALSVPPARKYQFDGGPTPGQFAELIRSKVDRDRLITRVLDLAERIPAAFVEAINDSGVGGLSTELPDRLVTLVSERSDRCGAALA